MLAFLSCSFLVMTMTQLKLMIQKKRERRATRGLFPFQSFLAHQKPKVGSVGKRCMY